MVDLLPLGLLFSFLPESEVRQLLFDEGYVPSTIRGILKDRIRSTVQIEFRLHKPTASEFFTAYWETKTGKVTYQWRSDKKPRAVGGGRWRIDFLSNINMGWRVRRLYGAERLSRDTLIHLDEFIDTIK